MRIIILCSPSLECLNAPSLPQQTSSAFDSPENACNNVFAFLFAFLKNIYDFKRRSSFKIIILLFINILWCLNDSYFAPKTLVQLLASTVRQRLWLGQPWLSSSLSLPPKVFCCPKLGLFYWSRSTGQTRGKVWKTCCVYSFCLIHIVEVS